MKRKLNRVIKGFLKLLNLCFPKKSNRLLFLSKPDFADNAQALYEKLTINNNYELNWLIDNDDILAKLQKNNIRAFKRLSLKGFYFFFTSKYIFSTHSQLSDIKSNKQQFVNLWHGMPLKALGFADESCSNEQLRDVERASRGTDLLIATSKIMKSAFSTCFHIEANKIQITGQPRNDKLFNENSVSNLEKILKVDIAKYDKVLIYMPTFRSGLGRIDGKEFDSNILQFEDYDFDELQKYLKDNNYLLIVKLHPYEEKDFILNKLKLPEHCILLKTNDLVENLMGLYDVLGAVDLLITDYSSVYFDYLILDKPIIFATSDIDMYTKQRGFLFDNYQFWTPGPKVNSMKGFLEEIQMFKLKDNYYKEERDLVNSLVNIYKDDKSSERILKLINLI